MNQLNQFLTAIAREHLGIETLEARNSDRLDFYDVGVWGVKNALRHAYQAGLDAALEEAGLNPASLAACRMVVDRWERGDLAEAARACQSALAQAEAACPPSTPSGSTPACRPRFEIEHDPGENSDRVYVLVDGKFDVAIIRTDEGVIVDVYPKEGFETIATAYAFDTDFEDDSSTNQERMQVMTIRHSPTPWTYEYNPYTLQRRDDAAEELPAFEVFDAEQNKVFDTNEDSPCEIQEANARLAAAAPELLAVLNRCAILLGDHNEQDGEVGAAYRDAIAAITAATTGRREP